MSNGDKPWVSCPLHAPSELFKPLGLAQNARNQRSLCDCFVSFQVQDLELDQLHHRHFRPPCVMGWIATLMLKTSIAWHTEPRAYFTCPQLSS